MQRGGKHQNGRGIEHTIDERCDNVRARLGHSDAREVIFVGNFERCGDHSLGEHVAKGERNSRLQNCDDEHGAYRRTKRAELCSPGAQENAVDKNHHGAFAIKQQIACVSVDERQNEAVDEANNEARRGFDRECRKRRPVVSSHTGKPRSDIAPYKAQSSRANAVIYTRYFPTRGFFWK